MTRLHLIIGFPKRRGVNTLGVQVPLTHQECTFLRPRRFPLVGPVPGLEGQYISAGFSGHGMTRAFRCLSSPVWCAACFGAAAPAPFPPFPSTPSAPTPSPSHVQLWRGCGAHDARPGATGGVPGHVLAQRPHGPAAGLTRLLGQQHQWCNLYILGAQLGPVCAGPSLGRMRAGRARRSSQR